MLEPSIKVETVATTLGVYEISIFNFEGTNVETLPKVFEGWSVVYRNCLELSNLRCPCAPIVREGQAKEGDAKKSPTWKKD